jgi:hypothetical protein
MTQHLRYGLSYIDLVPEVLLMPYFPCESNNDPMLVVIDPNAKGVRQTSFPGY